MNGFILFIVAALTSPTLNVSSPSFKQNGMIPSVYTCEGKNINPSITIKNIPAKTMSLALIVDDPDAPKGTFDHWVIWNIDPSATTINENSAPGTEGKNGSGKNGYMGPCPPSGTHHYYFKVYALNAKLNLAGGASKKQLEAAMKGHMLAKAELIGLYKKTK
jgi:Raf kinase inhibitor-like YbhB/YbcL family protein